VKTAKLKNPACFLAVRRHSFFICQADKWIFQRNGKRGIPLDGG